MVASPFLLASSALAADPGRIDAYVTPYYNSSGPVIRIGTFGPGLASADRDRFVATIFQMKKQWSRLNFIELYVAAIRLYDLGYRNEATYWFYSAQYAGRQFALLVNQKALGSVGDRSFELYHAQDAFFELVGPNVNGYAFGNVDSLVSIIRKVQRVNQTVPNLQSIYPGVVFASKSSWQRTNADLNSGLQSLAVQLASQKSEIEAQRAKNGTQARFSQVTSTRFPGGF